MSSTSPKREYVFEIIGHHARDTAHAALWTVPPTIDERYAQIAAWLPAVSAARADELATYLERLCSYRERRAVDRDEAAQRVLDVRRCSPGLDAIEIERVGSEWRLGLSRENMSQGTLYIDASDGRMRATQGA